MAVRRSFIEELNHEVLFEGNERVKKVVLNRPQKLNSITYNMITQMIKRLKEYEDNKEVMIVILKANGKAFSTGGDIKSAYNYMIAGHWSFGAKFYEKQLILDYLVATHRKTVVALVDGFVMGGGAGLSMNAWFRIATEKTVFAMPEAAMGHFPDAGASYFLSRLPGFIGEYVGLTGARLNGVQMVECGLATHFVLSQELPLLEDAIQKATCFTISAISEIITKFALQINGNKLGGLCKRSKVINRCFSEETVEDIMSSLKDEVENNGAQEWVAEAINSIRASPPTSLKLTLNSIRKGRREGLEQCLAREYTMFCHVVRGTVNGDFYEGMRALHLDKDKKPKWDPQQLELVSDEMVAKYFSKVEEDDWQFLQLPVRSKSMPRL